MESTAESPLPVRTVALAIGGWVGRLGRVWVEGQITQLTRRPACPRGRGGGGGGGRRAGGGGGGGSDPPPPPPPGPGVFFPRPARPRGGDPPPGRRAALARRRARPAAGRGRTGGRVGAAGVS